MTTNMMIRKIETLNEVEQMIEELKAEAESVKDSIKDYSKFQYGESGVNFTAFLTDKNELVLFKEAVEICRINLLSEANKFRNIQNIVRNIKQNKVNYDYIEIMACPGGCINGGGQPYVKPMFLPNEDADILETYRAKRAAVLYEEDERQPIRQSHNNPDIQKIYKDFLGEPCGELSEKLLHTTYNKNREKFPVK